MRLIGRHVFNKFAGSMGMLAATLSKMHIALVILGVALTISIAMNAASAKPANPIGALRAQCHREAGAYWNPGRRRWQYQGGIGTAQRQRFYDCLDRHRAQGH